VNATGVGLQRLQVRLSGGEQGVGTGSLGHLLVLYGMGSLNLREEAWKVLLGELSRASDVWIAHGDRLSSPVWSAQDGSGIVTW